MGVSVKFPVQKVESLKELVIELNGEYSSQPNALEQLEQKNPDFSFYQDSTLESLVETLKYNGMDENQIMTFSMALYGPVIDFYQVGSGEDEMFIMAVGQR